MILVSVIVTEVQKNSLPITSTVLFWAGAALGVKKAEHDIPHRGQRGMKREE
jgi:hypothetical protein